MWHFIKQHIQRLRYRGQQRYCPLCASHLSQFKSFGVVRRENAQCPVCKSLERHRLVWLFFTQHTDLLKGAQRRMLHVAPEEPIERQLRRLPYLDYLTADLHDPRCMLQMDLTDIPFPEASFDVIYASHVLEHVPDDRKAMAELYRVLKPGGWAVLLVPITHAKTEEGTHITDPQERARLFGQEDHVRGYGPDFADRLTEAGFSVQCLKPGQVVPAAEHQRLGVVAGQGEDIYLARRLA